MVSEQMAFLFEELGPEHNDIVGKKCANLGNLLHIGLSVPPGFALSIDMYREFIRITGIDEILSLYFKEYGELKGAGIAVFEELSQKVRSAIENQEMPPDLERMISSYYKGLCEKTGVEDRG